MFKSTSGFDKLLDKATSHLLLEPDWTAILQICDSIRQGDVLPKYAVSAIKKRLYAPNPHVELFALQVLESCVKNCGSPFHQEIASKSFMEELREVVKTTTNEKVKEKVLELVQTWAHAFRQEPHYRAVQDALNLMKMEGYKFPALKESDAMFAADSAPEWADGDCCHRCRVQFSVVQRKHHCRNCGQIFCHKCSSKLSTIPRFGIEKEVRVCEDCFDKLNKAMKLEQANKSSSSSAESSPYQSPPNKTSASTGGKTEQEIREEEELQLALALSQSEAESKEREQKKRSSSASASSKSSLKGNSYGAKSDFGSGGGSASKLGGSDFDDPELARYLNREYWEQRATSGHTDDITSTSPIPSAPQPQSNNNKVNMASITKVSEKFQNGESDETATFLNALRSAVEIFVNRMNSNQLRGRPIANDSAVQSLFMNITNMHSQLLKYIQEQDDARVHYEELQDKLGQIRDARAALDALREEHQEKLRREAEEAERIRQQQMAQKLEIMRKKKQEYLQYQREVALQRVQEQEREMLMRQEQQKYAIWQHQQQQQQQQHAMMYSVPQPATSYPAPQQGSPYPPPPPQYGQMQPPTAPGTVSPGHGPSPLTSQVYTAPTVGPPDYRQPYDMKAVAGALPNIPPNTIPQTNAPQPSGPVMMPPQQIMQNPPVSHGEQHQQENVPQPQQIPEAPLISFD